MKRERDMSTEVDFDGKNDIYTYIRISQTNDDDLLTLWLARNDGDSEDEVSCTISDDELEYLANRLLDFVAYHRKQIGKGK